MEYGRFYQGIRKGGVVKVQGPYADRPECQRCIANVKGRCKTLIDTHWIRYECPFLATQARIRKDKELKKRKEREWQKEDSSG